MWKISLPCIWICWLTRKDTINRTGLLGAAGDSLYEG